jgi:hypothetical protein
MSESWIDEAFAQVDQLTPATGFNVVAVDSMELPGEGLYLVSHHATQEEAEAARAAHQAASGDKTYVYAARDA